MDDRKVVAEPALELTEEIIGNSESEALSGALKRLQDRAQELHNSHYTKHSSHSVKHSSW